MTLPRGWRLGVLVATVAAMLAEVVYVDGVRFQHLIHSDTACTILRAETPAHWYWVNGDLWLLELPLAALSTALFGPGIEALRATQLLAFALEVAVLGWCFAQLVPQRWIALLAACATLLGISRLHFAFVYAEDAYGFLLTMFVLVFTQVGRLVPGPAPPRHWLAAGITLVAVATTNPTRFLAVALLPLVVAIAWPWRGVTVRFRLARLALVVGAWVAGLAIYRLALRHVFEFSPIIPHETFKLRDLAGLRENLVLLGRGLLFFTGDGAPFRPSSLLGLGFVGAAIVLVGAHVLSARTMTRTRFFATVLLVATGGLLVPLVFSDYMGSPDSIRYLAPAVLPMLGLVVVLHAERSARLAQLWLVLLPVVGAVGFERMLGATLETESGQWANRPSHPRLVAELGRRGLRHGFSTYWHANLVTLLSAGENRVCPVAIAGKSFVPYRWNTSTACFDRASLPPEIFFAAAPEDRAAMTAAMEAAFGAPRERFEVDDGFEVSVYPTATTNLAWLDVPIGSYDEIQFPLVLRASHPALTPLRGTVDGTTVIATGAPGAIVYGPYLNLSAGHYRVTWRGNGIASPGTIAFDVHARKRDYASVSFPASALHGKELASLPFVLDARTSGVELRVHSGDGGKVVLEQVRLERE